MAHRMGITDLRQGDCGPTITLGACEVKLVDQTLRLQRPGQRRRDEGSPYPKTCQPAIASSTRYRSSRSRTSTATRLYHFDMAKPEERQVVDPAYAYMVTDVLSNDGITWSRLTVDRPAATKTGTSEEFRDGIVMGYTPDLTIGVWMGNADNSPMANGTFSAQGVGPMWRAFMTQASQYLKFPTDKFQKPDDVVLISCGGRQEVFKANTPTVKNGACRGPSRSGPTASPSPRGPVFPTTASQSPTPVPTATPEEPATSQTPTPKPPQVYYYITREGDTVQSVARLFDVSVSDLARANGLTPDTPPGAGHRARHPRRIRRRRRRFRYANAGGDPRGKPLTSA